MSDVATEIRQPSIPNSNWFFSVVLCKSAPPHAHDAANWLVRSRKRINSSSKGRKDKETLSCDGKWWIKDAVIQCGFVALSPLSGGFPRTFDDLRAMPLQGCDARAKKRRIKAMQIIMSDTVSKWIGRRWWKSHIPQSDVQDMILLVESVSICADPCQRTRLRLLHISSKQKNPKEKKALLEFRRGNKIKLFQGGY